jgi:glycosyltransferase involved in cell wall biosynthesis
MSFTFVVVGHNEAERLPTALAQAIAAAQPGDEVWLLDSASTDGSAALAAEMEVPVLSVPRGKGRALACALDAARTDYLVVVDGDIDRTSRNFPLALRDVTARSGADLVVGEIDEPRRTLRHTSRFIWGPLVGALFEEVDGRFGKAPLTGFRSLRTAFPLGPIPPGYGVETHMNLVAALHGKVEVAAIGTYWGPLRHKPELGAEVGAAILDYAEVEGRLAPSRRPAWDSWVEGVVSAVAVGPPRHVGDAPADPGADQEFVARVEAAASRPLPPAGL